jgi:predicted ATPase
LSNAENKRYEVFKYGSAWLKADFHLHTKADKEFKYDDDVNRFINNYVQKLKENNINIGVITNHNKFDYDEFKELRKKAIREEIYLLPGVEFSLKEGKSGIHTLVVFSDEWIFNKENKNYIQDLITISFSGQNNFENENSCSNNDIESFLIELEKFEKDYFIIFAHVEQDKGLWSELKGNLVQRLGQNEMFKRKTLGFQKVRTFNAANTERTDRPCKKKVADWLINWYPAEVEGSDCKNIDEVGKVADCYIKVGDYNFEALKYALSDNKSRVLKEKPEHARSYIKSVIFEGGIFSKKEICFSSGLNTVIGIRGSGKSSIIESLRYVLDIQFGDKAQDDKYKRELIRHTLESGGKICIKAIDRFGQEYEIRRILNEQPEVLVNGVVQPGVTIKETVIYKPIYFGQKDLSSSGEGFEKDLVEKLIGEKNVEIRAKIEEQKNKVQLAVKRFLKLSSVEDKLKEYFDKKNDAEHRLSKYKQYKIEEKLQKQIDFDADSRKCSQIISSVKSFIDSLNEVLTQHEDEIKNNQNYQSKQNSLFFSKFFKIYAKILLMLDNLKKIIEQSEASLTELTTQEKELEKIKDAFKEEFAEVERRLSESLKSSGADAIKPDEYKQINKILEQAKAMLEELEKEKSRSELVKTELFIELSTLNNLWYEEFNAIQTELKKINFNHSKLIIRNEYKGDTQAFIMFMKENFKGSNIRETLFKKIAEEFQDFHEIYKAQDKAQKILGASWTSFSEYFNKYLEIFLTWQKPNKFSIEYYGKELKEHSLGQRASALILFVLSQKENDVIIIDQPEDDLDNQTIYQDVIKLIMNLKLETQFILATHNPNIPVLGDAEQVVSCNYSNETIELKEGSIDDPLIQKEIVSIMEGGEEAFNKRKEIYQIWKPRN